MPEIIDLLSLLNIWPKRPLQATQYPILLKFAVISWIKIKRRFICMFVGIVGMFVVVLIPNVRLIGARAGNAQSIGILYIRSSSLFGNTGSGLLSKIGTPLPSPSPSPSPAERIARTGGR